VSSESSPHAPAPRARYFVTGLLTVIPLAVTGFIFVWLVRLLSAIGRVPAAQLKKAVRQWTDFDAGFLSSGWFTDLVSVVVVLFSIYFLGMMMSNFLGQKVVGFFEAVLERIPFVKSVYGAVKKLVSLMRQDSNENVQRVVLIDFPSPEMKTIGLVTRTFRDAVTGRQLASVYVPTTPNPTSGYLEIVPVEKLTMTNLSFDDAMSMVVSGGAIAPDTIHYDVSWKPPGSPQS